MIVLLYGLAWVATVSACILLAAEFRFRGQEIDQLRWLLKRAIGEREAMRARGERNYRWIHSRIEQITAGPPDDFEPHEPPAAPAGRTNE